VLSLEAESAACDDVRRNVAVNPDLTGLITVRQAFVGAPGTTIDELARQHFVSA
jgi:hypothetical protein